MAKETTYRKTPAGSEAIATRAAGLTPRQRSLLILVDGKRTTTELAALTSASGDSQELLQGLLEHGFIEAVAQREAVPAKSAPRPAAAAGIPLPQARSLAVRRLTDLLGPSASDLCIKLESTRSADEFRAALRRVEGILREVVGATRASQFVAEVENLRAT